MNKSLVFSLLMFSIFPLAAMEQGGDDRGQKRPGEEINENAPKKQKAEYKSLVDCCKEFMQRERKAEDIRSAKADEIDMEKVLALALPLDITCHVLANVHQSVIDKHDKQLRGLLVKQCDDTIKTIIIQRLANIDQCDQCIPLINDNRLSTYVKCKLIERVPGLQSLEVIEKVAEQGPITTQIAQLFVTLLKANDLIRCLRGTLLSSQARSFGNEERIAKKLRECPFLEETTKKGWKFNLIPREISTEEQERAAELLGQVKQEYELPVEDFYSVIIDPISGKIKLKFLNIQKLNKYFSETFGQEYREPFDDNSLINMFLRIDNIFSDGSFGVRVTIDISVSNGTSKAQCNYPFTFVTKMPEGFVCKKCIISQELEIFIKGIIDGQEKILTIDLPKEMITAQKIAPFANIILEDAFGEFLEDLLLSPLELGDLDRDKKRKNKQPYANIFEYLFKYYQEGIELILPQIHDFLADRIIPRNVSNMTSEEKQELLAFFDYVDLRLEEFMEKATAEQQEICKKLKDGINLFRPKAS